MKHYQVRDKKPEQTLEQGSNEVSGKWSRKNICEGRDLVVGGKGGEREGVSLGCRVEGWRGKGVRSGSEVSCEGWMCVYCKCKHGSRLNNLNLDLKRPPCGHQEPCRNFPPPLSPHRETLLARATRASYFTCSNVELVLQYILYCT